MTRIKSFHEWYMAIPLEDHRKLTHDFTEDTVMAFGTAYEDYIVEKLTSFANSEPIQLPSRINKVEINGELNLEDYDGDSYSG